MLFACVKPSWVKKKNGILMGMKQYLIIIKRDRKALLLLPGVVHLSLLRKSLMTMSIFYLYELHILIKLSDI